MILLKNVLNYFRNKHDLFYKIFLFVNAVFLIVFFFPKEAAFKYDYQKNKPWFHEDLLAPYDIPIFRTEKEISNDKKYIIKYQKLYFSYKNEVINNKLDELDTIIAVNFDKFYQKQVSNGLKFELSKDKSLLIVKSESKNILNKIYNKGIIQSIPEIDEFTDSSEFYVYKNKYYGSYNIADVYTQKSANEYLNSILKAKSSAINNIVFSLLELCLEQHPENIVYNDLETKKNLENEVKKVDETASLVLKGQAILKRGDIVDDYKFRVLRSFEKKHQSQYLSSQKRYTIGIGQTLLVAILIACLAMYFMFFRKTFLDNNKNIVFILLIVVLSIVSTSIILQYNLFSVYLMPLCLVPLIVRSFFDSRTAFFVHLIGALILGFVIPNGLHFIFIQVVAGMVGIYGFVNFRNRSQLFITTLIILLAYLACYTALNVVVEGDFNKIDWYTFGWLCISAFLTLLAYPIIYVFEKAFGFVSDVTLLELADTNNKLLRTLSRKAPGTFQHSLQVANLAEAAIHKVEGNALLIRTAALYHDIGKMDAPMYFIENQSTGVNPHDELSYEESAQIIINHVIKGVEIAKQNNLPELIIDFIRTHHGTTKTEFFYRKYLEENPDDENTQQFSYPGPVPFSKESAILMMADSVEAASRSIKLPNVEKIDALVENIINKQMNNNQFVNSDITLKDINQIKKIFKKMLMNIYHVRVEYPH